MGQRGLGWKAPCDGVDGCRGLDDPALTRPTGVFGTAGIFGTAGDNHPELGRDDIQPFADILPIPARMGPDQSSRICSRRELS